MKATSFVFVAVMVFAASARSQVTDPGDSREPAAVPVTSPATARILGDIPDGTPPPPQAPKPAFVVPPEDVISTTTHQQGGRTITIQEIKPIPLPPPPAPAPPAPVIDDPAFEAQLAEQRAQHPGSPVLVLGPTVYHSKDAPPRTLIRYQYGSAGESVTFWSSADFALFPWHLSFAGSDGRIYDALLFTTSVDRDRMAASHAADSRAPAPPDIPELPAGPATFVVVGDPPADESVLVPIQSLHDLYNSEFDRLKTACEGRERARIEREAYLKANPPQPKDVTLRFWRTERPAPAKGGAK